MNIPSKRLKAAQLLFYIKAANWWRGRRRWCGAIQGGQSRIFTKTNVVKYF